MYSTQFYVNKEMFWYETEKMRRGSEVMETIRDVDSRQTQKPNNMD